MEALDSNVLLRTPSPTCRWEKQCTANMVVRFHPAPLWSVSVSVITPACHAGDGGFDSRTDRWGWYVPRTVAYREGRKHAIVMWSNTPKEQKCLSRIVVRADDEFE